MRITKAIVAETTKHRPTTEPHKSRWYRLHVKHLRALREQRLGDACTLADRKSAIWLEWYRARLRLCFD